MKTLFQKNGVLFALSLIFLVVTLVSCQKEVTNSKQNAAVNQQNGNAH